MLKITPYLGIIVIIVSIGGVFYPKLGYFFLLVFASLMLIAPFRGRWFCGNLCPRGSFVDFWLAPITRRVRIPSSLRSMWLRVPIFFVLMGFMAFRIIQTQGIIDRIGMVFVTLCILTTLIAILFGLAIAPRTWCSFAPWALCRGRLAAANTSSRWTGPNASIAANARRSAPCSFPSGRLGRIPIA